MSGVLSSPRRSFCVMVSFRFGPSRLILSSRLSDTGPAPKSLLAGSIFQTPFRFGLVWPCANPQARINGITIRFARPATHDDPLLLLQHNLPIPLAHGAGDVPLDGKRLAVRRKRPEIGRASCRGRE